MDPTAMAQLAIAPGQLSPGRLVPPGVRVVRNGEPHFVREPSRSGFCYRGLPFVLSQIPTESVDSSASD
jgi:hypothetical protein